jgi:HEAT repeat protein
VPGTVRAHQATDALLLRDENAEVRRHAIASPTRIADPGSAERIGDTLKDADWRVRTGAAPARAAIGNGKRPAYLKAASCDENGHVRKIAHAMLKSGEEGSCTEHYGPP